MARLAVNILETVAAAIISVPEAESSAVRDVVGASRRSAPVERYADGALFAVFAVEEAILRTARLALVARGLAMRSGAPA